MSVKMTDASIANVTASATGNVAPGSYSLEVSQLAQAQKLASTAQASTTAAIGAGTITFDLGTTTAARPAGIASFTSSNLGLKTVTIDPANTSLAGIRDAINKAGIGVSASIVNDGTATPYRLVLTQAATGEASSMNISVSGSAGIDGLIAHQPGGGQVLQQMVPAQNAKFKLDGLDVSSATNAASGVIEGMTLNLAKTNVGSPTTFTVGAGQHGHRGLGQAIRHRL